MQPFSLSKIAVVGVVIALFTPSQASANPGITGYSGKPYDGVNDICTTKCHSGGTAPTLQITVPTALKAGESADVTIVVNGNAARTSMNAALSDGVKATAGQNTAVPFPVQTPGEVAAIVPPPGGGSGTYKFSFVAPNRNGSITLWVAGMAASGGGSGGDGVAATTRTINVTGATAPPPDDGGPPGNGSTPGGGGGTDGGGKATDGGSSSSDDDDDDDDGASTSGGRGRRLAAQDAGGCATSRSTPVDTAAMACGAVTALVFARRRKRGNRD